MLPQASRRAYLSCTFCSYSFLRQLSSLVLVEHRNGNLSSNALNAVSAAKALGGPISALVAGQDVQKVANQAASIDGVSEVLVADVAAFKNQLAEPYALLLNSLQTRRNFTHIVAASTSFGKNIIPRAAGLLGSQPLTDVLQIIDSDTFVRPIYAGNALSTAKYVQPGLRMILVRPSSFAPASQGSTPTAKVSAVDDADLAAAASGPPPAKWLGQEVRVSERPELGSARVVVCGGRPLKSADNFKMLESLADVLGGAVGASRAAVDAGYVSNDLQVGQTGKVIAPDLYIGVGISGAIQHLAGMKDSKVIVAINADPEAPLFQIADYGLVGDLFTIVPQLEAELRTALAKS